MPSTPCSRISADAEVEPAGDATIGVRLNYRTHFAAVIRVSPMARSKQQQLLGSG